MVLVTPQLCSRIRVCLNAFCTRYGGVVGKINTKIGSQNVLIGSEHGYPPHVTPRPADTAARAAFSYSHTQQVVHTDNIDCCHPYWQTHRRVLLYLTITTPFP